MRRWPPTAARAGCTVFPTQEVQWELAGHESRSAHDVYLAMQGRTFWSRAFDALFDEFDFVVLPGAQVFPFDKTVHWPTHVAGVEMENYQAVDDDL